MDTGDMTMTLLERPVERSCADLPACMTRDETAYGILAAMRRLRRNLDMIGGDHLLALADSAIRDRLFIRNLQHGCFAEASDLSPPEAGALGHIAEIVMMKAADTCSRYATNTAASRGTFYVLLLLLDRLVEVWHHPLSEEQLIGWLTWDEDDLLPASLLMVGSAIPATLGAG